MVSVKLSNSILKTQSILLSAETKKKKKKKKKKKRPYITEAARVSLEAWEG